jgi:hypothetical protein
MKTATYRGRTYKLEFIGQTKFGKRAKLAFLDGSKEFWVSASEVKIGGDSSKSPVRIRPCTCDSDPSGICPRCG